MVILGLIGLSLAMIDPPAPAGPSPDELKTYRAERQLAGRDAAAHVRLALWCERHGMKAERLKHLAIAVIADPSNAAARGLLGFVSDHGAWVRADQVAEKAKADDLAARLDYADRRSKLKDDADSNWKMALWCSEKGLVAEATAHLRRVVRLDPGREDAWKRLGYRKHGGRWQTDAQVAASKVEADAQAKADRHWRPILERAKGWLGEKAHREKAEKSLAEISDPRAVPMVIETFARGGPTEQLTAARILGQIDSPAASRALAKLGAFGGSTEVRRIATETLRRRDPREFAGFLIGLLREPVRYTVKRGAGPGGVGELFVEGERYDLKRRYLSPASPDFIVEPEDRIAYDAAGYPVLIRPLESGEQTYVAWQVLPAWIFTAPVARLQWQSNQIVGQAIQGDLQSLRRGSLTPSHFATQVTATIAAAPAAYNPSTESSGGLSTLDIQQNAAYFLDCGGGTPLQNLFAQGITRGGILPVPASSELTVRTVAQIPVGRMASAARRSAENSKARLESDIAAIEAHNRPIHERNAGLRFVLETATGQDHGEDPKAWGAWLADLNGIALVQAQATAREVVIENVQPLEVPADLSITLAVDPIAFRFGHSCFAGGTTVRTLAGPRPIESLALGDQVLTQDTTSGSLSYQPVLAVYHNPPNGTLKIDLGDDSVVCTGIHRLWSPGRGWVMARDLKPGDPLRTLGGVASIRSIEKDATQKVFNLEVASGQSFFVGERGVLVHDNSVVSPTAEPFDEPKAAAAKSAD